MPWEKRRIYTTEIAHEYFLRIGASCDGAHVPRRIEVWPFPIPGERCVAGKTRLACVAVLLYITACFQVFTVEAAGGSPTASHNEDDARPCAHARTPTCMHVTNHT